MIAKTVTVTVEGDGGGQFRIHGPQATARSENAAGAIAEAEAMARASARSAVLEMGGEEPEIRVSIERYFLPDAVDENGLLAAEVTAEAASRPVVHETI